MLSEWVARHWQGYHGPVPRHAPTCLQVKGQEATDPEVSHDGVEVVQETLVLEVVVHCDWARREEAIIHCMYVIMFH